MQAVIIEIRAADDAILTAAKILLIIRNPRNIANFAALQSAGLAFHAGWGILALTRVGDAEFGFSVGV
jgi:hypothetical protein